MCIICTQNYLLWSKQTLVYSHILYCCGMNDKWKSEPGIEKERVGERQGKRKSKYKQGKNRKEKWRSFLYRKGSKIKEPHDRKGGIWNRQTESRVSRFPSNNKVYPALPYSDSFDSCKVIICYRQYPHRNFTNDYVIAGYFYRNLKNCIFSSDASHFHFENVNMEVLSEGK